MIYFVIISTDLMGKLMDHICGRWDSLKDNARYFGNGVRIHLRELRWYNIPFAPLLRTETGLQLEVEDGDMIDFYTQQLGGIDNIQQHHEEAPEQVENIQAPCNATQNQTRAVENALMATCDSVRRDVRWTSCHLLVMLSSRVEAEIVLISLEGKPRRKSSILLRGASALSLGQGLWHAVTKIT